MAKAQSRNDRRDDPNKSLVVIEQELVKTEPKFRELAEAACRRMDYHQEAAFALSIIKESEALQKCHPESFVEAFTNLGAMGLSLNRNLGHAALIPRWNSKRKSAWAVCMPMYRGYISLATGGSTIKNVWGGAVVDGDFIDFELGSAPFLKHKPKIGKRGEGAPVPNFDNMLGTYCCADIFGSDKTHITWISIDDVIAIAKRSDSFNPTRERDEYVNGQKTGKRYLPEPSGPWVTDPGQMGVKSAFRRGYKTWPGIDKPEYRALQEAVRVDTEAEVLESAPADDKTQADTVVSAETCVSADEAKALSELCIGKKLRPERFAKAYGVERIADIPAEQFLEAKKRIEAIPAKAA